MKKTITIGTDALLLAARRMFVRKEITEEQLLEMYRGNDELPEAIRKSTIELR